MRLGLIAALLVLAGCGGAARAGQAPVVPPERLLVLERERGTNVATISIVHPDGSGRRRLADGVDGAFSPDGREVAVVTPGADAGDGLAIVEVATGTSRTVPLPRRPGGGGPSSVSWSPDGRRLAYTAPLRSGEEPPWELATVRVDGTHRRRLTRGRPGDDFDAADWSPDGQTIAYSRGQMVIEGIRPDGRGRRVLFGRRLRTIARDPEWSPDGRRLALATDDSKLEVVVVRRDGSNPRTVGNGEAPVWLPGGRALVYVPATGPDTPAVVALDGRRTTRRLPLPTATVVDWRRG